MGLFRTHAERVADREAKRAYKLKKLAIKKDVALSEDLRNTAADNLMLASLGIDHTIDENGVKIAKVQALGGIANGVLGVLAGTSPGGTIQNPVVVGGTSSGTVSAAGTITANGDNSMILVAAGVVLLILIMKK
jgi:hypothetical protein